MAEPRSTVGPPKYWLNLCTQVYVRLTEFFLVFYASSDLHSKYVIPITDTLPLGPFLGSILVQYRPLSMLSVEELYRM
jgi:hypothetical protein